MLFNLAKLFKTNSYDLKTLDIKVIMLTGEILYDHQRRFIEQVFHCPISNEYGASEIGMVAAECPYGGMHLQEETVYVYTNSGNEVIITELHNELTPLINFRVGDKISISSKKCSCGRGLRLIDSIEGRIASDDIIKPNGERINYLLVNNMITDLKDSTLWNYINGFKVLQKGNDFFIYVVTSKENTQDITSYLTSFLKKNIDSTINVNIEFVDKILPDKSGKMRLFSRDD